MTKGANRILEARYQALKDLETASMYLPESYVEELRSIYQHQINHQKVVLDLYTGTFRQRLSAYLALKKGVPWLSKYQFVLLLFLLPRPSGDWCAAWLRRH